ncbi:DUF2269 domain-containing protein [Amylibacter sp. IMCC11727]|uniref:DUF2269 family protein n=1 Tax=Amylibacter sp. IMCC11727 TaxID=3039851 RepID=UPI00244E16BE|nr:DUF2269 domain-containing protein [Amylibacter sp. IMCC11727]WGI21075.1 DUF2269 domain-containing protein [Amylibacter sp. IMCC11727]
MELDLYLIAKWIHILSSTVLFGTGIGTAFQMVWAWRSQNPQTIAHVSGGVVIADWLFTTPAGLVQPLSGLALIALQGWSLNAPWLLATYALYVLAFICWAPVVHLQIRIRNLARTAAQNNAPLPPEARRAFRLWFALGWPAFAALVAIFWLMISKPDLGF